MIATEPRRLRRALTTAVVSLIVVPLGACTFHPTDTIYTPAQGVNERSGEIKVLNAMIVSSEAGEGRLIAGLANGDQDEADALTGVTGVEDDSSVQVQLEGGSTEIPPAGFLQLAGSDAARLMVSGESVEAGRFVRLSFEFERGAPVELHVPVVEPGTDFAGVMSPSASPSDVESASPSASPTDEATESE